MRKRIKTKVSGNIDGSFNIDINCKICGEPIIQSNKFGMYCRNKCGMKDDMKAYTKIKRFVSLFGIHL